MLSANNEQIYFNGAEWQYLKVGVCSGRIGSLWFGWIMEQVNACDKEL